MEALTDPEVNTPEIEILPEKLFISPNAIPTSPPPGDGQLETTVALTIPKFFNANGPYEAEKRPTE
jgi:hypothetical protein